MFWLPTFGNHISLVEYLLFLPIDILSRSPNFIYRIFCVNSNRSYFLATIYVNYCIVFIVNPLRWKWQQKILEPAALIIVLNPY